LETFTFTASDGSGIFCRRWLPEPAAHVRGAVMIVHGMAEHSLRYDAFARSLTARGLAVYAQDLRGHGHTAEGRENLGYFAESNGWELVVDDLKILSDRIRTDHPQEPFFLFGHSMGSFLARDFMARYGERLWGAILSGTAAHPGFLGMMGRLAARAQARIRGSKSPSPLLDKLSFGNYAKAFAPARTAFDWLSRDPEQVDRYIRDPLCGFICSAGFFVDMLSGLIRVNRADHFAGVRKDLPLLMISGSRDPVGSFGKGVRKVHDAYKLAGVGDLTLMLYDQGRHEMLNEINRERVVADVIQWIDEHVRKT